MAKGKHPDQGRIEKIQSDSARPGERVRKLFEQMEQPAARRPSLRPPREETRPDRYQSGKFIPKFLDAVQKKMEGSWVYRTFKLPGTNYVVRDQRNAEKNEAKKESAFEMKDGKLSEAKTKSYVNYLGDRSKLGALQLSRDETAELGRLLSKFEKTLVERFEKGKTLEQASKDGKAHFKEKSEAQWKEFFSKFLKRSTLKNSELKMLKSFLFRGLFSLKKGDGKFAMLIGDMAMTDGQIQKFARLKVLSQLMKALANVEPGSKLEAELLRKGLNSEDFKYLTLAHKHDERAIKTGAKATGGMFGDLKTEEDVAKKLGLRRKKGGGKGYGGPISWGEEGGSEDKKHQFVPWGWWEREDRTKWSKLFTMILTLVITLLILTGAWMLISFFL